MRYMRAGRTVANGGRCYLSGQLALFAGAWKGGVKVIVTVTVTVIGAVAVTEARCREERFQRGDWIAAPHADLVEANI